jgi:uncharacterized protein (DUF952 family)
MSLIYHITTKHEWQAAREKGFYEAASLATEGLIHCCDEAQLAGVLERYYPGRQDLLELMIETDKLTSKFIFEWSPSSADTFPHIYGPVNLDAVVAIKKIN